MSMVEGSLTREFNVRRSSSIHASCASLGAAPTKLLNTVRAESADIRVAFSLLDKCAPTSGEVS